MFFFFLIIIITNARISLQQQSNRVLETSHYTVNVILKSKKVLTRAFYSFDTVNYGNDTNETVLNLDDKLFLFSRLPRPPTRFCSIENRPNYTENK